MSKANSVPKLLRVAIRRVEEAWGKNAWSQKTNKKGRNGKHMYAVCLEGAIFGYCRYATTQVQRDAIAIVEQILKERGYVRGDPKNSIPGWNDSTATQEEVIDVLKEALIRAETGGLMTDEEFEITDEEIAEILAQEEKDACAIKTQEELLGF